MKYKSMFLHLTAIGVLSGCAIGGADADAVLNRCTGN